MSIKFIKTTDGFYYNSGKKWVSRDGVQHECTGIDEYPAYFLVHEDSGTIRVNKEDVMICKYAESVDPIEVEDNAGNR